MSTRLHTSAIEQVGPGAPLSSIYTSTATRFFAAVGVAWDVQGNGKTVVRAGVSSCRDFTNMLARLGHGTPFGANFPSIGVNNSGTAINAHTPVTPVLTARMQISATTCHLNCRSTDLELAGPYSPVLPPRPLTASPILGLRSPTTATVNGVPIRRACHCRAVDPNFRRRLRRRVESGHPARHHQ